MADTQRPSNLPMLISPHELMLKTNYHKMVFANTARFPARPQAKSPCHPTEEKIRQILKRNNRRLSENPKEEMKAAMLVQYSPMKVLGNRVFPSIIKKRTWKRQDSKDYISSPRLKVELNLHLGITRMRFLPQRHIQQENSINIKDRTETNNNINLHKPAKTPLSELSKLVLLKGMKCIPYKEMSWAIPVMKTDYQALIRERSRAQYNKSNEKSSFVHHHTPHQPRIPGTLPKALVVEGKKGLSRNEYLDVIRQRKSVALITAYPKHKPTLLDARRNESSECIRYKEEDYESREFEPLCPWGTYD